MPEDSADFISTVVPAPVRNFAPGGDDGEIYFVSGQPESLADGNALSPGTTASCL
jgi:hypothetical protein